MKKGDKKKGRREEERVVEKDVRKKDKEAGPSHIGRKLNRWAVKDEKGRTPMEKAWRDLKAGKGSKTKVRYCISELLLEFLL